MSVVAMGSKKCKEEHAETIDLVHLIKEESISIKSEVSALKDQIIKQNGRVTKLEDQNTTLTSSVAQFSIWDKIKSLVIWALFGVTGSMSTYIFFVR